METREKLIERAMDDGHQIEVNYTDEVFQHPQGILTGPRGAFIGTSDDLKRLARAAQALDGAKEALEHYRDSNHWACEQSDADHAGQCTQKLYRGSLLAGYKFADRALAEISNIQNSDKGDNDAN